MKDFLTIKYEVPDTGNGPGRPAECYGSCCAHNDFGGPKSSSNDRDGRRRVHDTRPAECYGACCVNLNAGGPKTSSNTGI